MPFIDRRGFLAGRGCDDRARWRAASGTCMPQATRSSWGWSTIRPTSSRWRTRGSSQGAVKLAIYRSLLSYDAERQAADRARRELDAGGSDRACVQAARRQVPQRRARHRRRRGIHDRPHQGSEIHRLPARGFRDRRQGRDHRSEDGPHRAEGAERAVPAPDGELSRAGSCARPRAIPIRPSRSAPGPTCSRARARRLGRGRALPGLLQARQAEDPEDQVRQLYRRKPARRGARVRRHRRHRDAALAGDGYASRRIRG